MIDGTSSSEIDSPEAVKIVSSTNILVNEWSMLLGNCVYRLKIHQVDQGIPHPADFVPDSMPLTEQVCLLDSFYFKFL